MEVKKGLYRHFKGNFYFVLYLATHTETGETMVVYKDLTTFLNQTSNFYCRPLSSFIEPAIKDGKEIERFTFIGSAVD